MNKKSIILGLTLALVGCLPMGASFAAGTPHFKNNKAVAEYFWNEVFNKHDTAVIDTMVGPKYKQHSPEFADGKQAFKDGVSGFLKAYPDSTAVMPCFQELSSWSLREVSEQRKKLTSTRHS